MPIEAAMSVSVVVERRPSSSPWQDFVWRPIGVVPLVACEDWKLLAQGEDWTQFQSGALRIELHRRDTEGYLVNLSQTPPQVYVVLRGARGGDGDIKTIEPFLATVCPYEAVTYDKGGDEIVEGVPMPPEVAAWVAEFVSLHHVDTPFQKRKNKRHGDKESGGPLRDRRGEVAS